jgi:GGDEF domain-containing protein
MPEQSPDAARRRLEQLARRIAAHRFTAGGERVRLTAAIGLVPFSFAANAADLRRQALEVLDSARRQAAPDQGDRPRIPLERAAQALFPTRLALLVSLVFPFLLAIAWGTGGRFP